MYVPGDKPSEESIRNSLLDWFLYCKDPRNDGYSSWPLKQRMIRLNLYLTELLSRMPTYAGEKEWIEDLKTEQAFKEISR
jgi:hypothetical protein